MERKGKAISGLLVAAGIVASALLIGAAPAAASYTAYHGSDFARTTVPNEDYLMVCDKEADNHGVYGRFILNTGSYLDGADSNGSAAGCAELDLRATPYWTVRLEAVERNVGGGGYVWTDGLSGN